MTSAPAAARARAELASYWARRGDRAKAEDFIARVAAGNYLDHHVAYSVGAAYAQLRNPVQARRWLERAVNTGFSCYPWYARDALLDPVRGDPGVRQFMDRLEQSWEDAKVRYAE